MMKYKVLKSIAHNFSQSFLSGMNYVDGGHVVEDLFQLVRQSDGQRFSVQWIPDSVPARAFPARIAKSIALYKEWLPAHIERAGGSIERIREFRTEIFVKRNKQMAAQAYLVDDRGKQYVCRVLF
jgi:hypothetical protein